VSHVEDVDPEVLAARALQAAVAPGLDVTKLVPADARAAANKVAMVFNDGLPGLPRVETMFIDGPAGELRCRLYQPEDAAGRGVVYFIHGGGWFSCNVDTHDRTMRYLAAASGLSVFGIDYRLSPEHVFPAALQDCLAGWRFLHAAAASLRIDAGRICIAGDSAGATLALSLMLHGRDAGRDLPQAAALLYGCYAPGLQNASRARYGNGAYGLTAARMDWYWQQYLGAAAGSPSTIAVPLLADFRGLPPHYIGYAECDILADENRLVATRMRDAGVITTLKCWPRVTHGVLQMTRDVAAARAAADAVAGWVKGLLF
jgi:acetyl esterase